MSDLVKPSDAEWLTGFLGFLLEHQVASKEDLKKAAQIQRELDTRLGHLAVLKGFLQPHDVYFLMGLKLESAVPFGELAMKRGLLTQAQIDELLRIQSNLFLLFLECLSLSRTIVPKKLRQHLDDFLRTTILARRGSVTLPETVKPSRGDDLTPQDLHSRDLEFWKTIRRIKTLGTLPAVVQRTMNLLDDPGVTLAQVGRELQSDPAISSQILKIGNSAFYSLTEKVSAIDRAVVTLGSAAVRQIMLAAVVLEKFKDIELKEAKILWHHAVLTAKVARTLADHRKMSGLAEDAFGAGLLHCIGKFALLQYFPEATLAVQNLVRKGLPVDDAEREVLGTTHAEVGAYLCRFWQYPDPMVESALYHKASLSVLGSRATLSPITGMVHAACRIANLPTDKRLPQELAAMDEPFLAYHKLTREYISGILPALVTEARGVVAALFT